MPPPIEAAPTKQEVERQLGRMMACDIFASRLQPAKLLRFIVEETLRGEEITEKFIRGHIFPTPPYAPESTIARRTMDLVRDILAEYYATTGKDEPVIISLPKSPPGKRIKFQAGQAYAPRFDYNPLNSAVLKMRLAIHQLHQVSYEEAMDSAVSFADLSSHPGLSAAAQAGLAEALLVLILHEIKLMDFPKAHVETAKELSETAVSLSPHHWHTHAALGVVMVCLHNLVKAGEEFAIALKLDKAKTDGYFGYAIFLMTVGRYSEALVLVGLTASERVEDAFAQAFHGLVLYVLRHFDDAEQALRAAIRLDRHCWLAHNALAMLLADTRRPNEALRHLGRLQVALDERIWTMPGLVMICTARARNLDPEGFLKNLETAAAIVTKIVEHRDKFQLALTSIGLHEMEKGWLSLPNPDDAHIENALNLLRGAFTECSPLALWLHLWPILEPLRALPKFQEMLRESCFPAPPAEQCKS
jgi:tetratricopeptide (TPR) repeat protein